MGLNEGRKNTLLTATFSYMLGRKILDRICRMPNATFIAYERLVENGEEEVRRVCQHIGIQFESQMVSVQFSRNTSFRNAYRRDRVFSRKFDFDNNVIRIVNIALKALPLFAMKGIWDFNEKFRRRVTPFSSGTYRYLLKRYDADLSLHSNDDHLRFRKLST